jgi:hypothetical protein
MNQDRRNSLTSLLVGIVALLVVCSGSEATEAKTIVTVSVSRRVAEMPQSLVWDSPSHNASELAALLSSVLNKAFKGEL